MSALKITDLFNTLEETRATLLTAMNGDGIVSRADLKRLLQQTEDPLRKRFLEFFFGFLIKLENRPRMRVTEEVIDRGMAFIREQIIPQFEIRESFADATNQEIAQIHESAFPMAMELLRITASQQSLDPKAVSEQIAELSEGLFFDDYGSEAAIAIESFFLEHPDQTLTPESFVQALGVDPNTPKGVVARFDPADGVLLTFVEQHFRTEGAESARRLVELMQQNLKDHTIIVLGEDNHPDLESNHPVYVVGMGENGDLAGFESVVIWT